MSSCKQALIKAVNGHRFAFLSLGVSILVGIVIGVDGGDEMTNAPKLSFLWEQHQAS